MKRRRWWIGSLVYALVAILIGFGVATATNGLLALSIEPKQAQPTAPIPVTRVAAAVAPPDIATVAMPAGYRDDPLLVMAARVVPGRGGSQRPVRVRVS